jgi:cell division protein FtsB
VVRPRPAFSPPKTRYLRAAFRGKSLAVSPRLRWGLAAILLAIYVVHFVGGDHGLLRRMELRKELDQLAVDNSHLLLEKERLLQEVQLKENDPLSLERLAREKYWMIGPGETVYRFEENEVVPELPKPGGPEAPSPSPAPATGEGVDGRIPP